MKRRRIPIMYFCSCGSNWSWGALAGVLVVLAVARATGGAAGGAAGRHRRFRRDRHRRRRGLWRVASQLAGDYRFCADFAGGGGCDCGAARLKSLGSWQKDG